MGYSCGDCFPGIPGMEFHLVQNRKENCHHDHIPFNVKGNGKTVFSVQKFQCDVIAWKRLSESRHSLIDQMMDHEDQIMRRSS